MLASILACQAGKDVYCEKPLSLYIPEGRALVTAARKYGRVVQHGTQQRTIEINRFACEFVRDGAVFVGEDCKIEINRNKFSTNPPDFIKNSPDPKLAEKWEGDGWVAKGHVENWFDCIRTLQKPNADVEIGHRTASLCQLLVITRERGRRLKWDPEKEIFPDDEEANSLLDRPRRKGWELPRV